MDTYLVRYEIQKSDGYWAREEEIIAVEGKAKHKEVISKWESRHKKDVVRLIGVYFQ